MWIVLSPWLGSQDKQEGESKADFTPTFSCFLPDTRDDVARHLPSPCHSFPTMVNWIPSNQEPKNNQPFLTLGQVSGIAEVRPQGQREEVLWNPFNSRNLSFDK